MLDHERDAQAAIRAVYGRPVVYTGAGLDAVSIVAIRSDTAASRFQGFGGRPEGLSFEIERHLLPDRPRKGNLIVEANGARWSVNDIDESDEIDSFILSVREAEPQP